MTLEQRLILAFQQIGDDIQTLINQGGNLANLNTTAKGDFVAAINEVLAIANSATGVIDDTSIMPLVNKTYSISKILDLLQGLKQDILGGVPVATFDTIKEIADYIGTDQTAMQTLTTALENRVRFNSAQNLTSGEQAQARTNIGALSIVEIGNPDTDFLSVYTTAKTT